MYQYLSLLFNLWLISAAEIPNEEVEVKNRSPLILTPYHGFYYFPIKARITTNQKQEIYYSKKKDGRFFCPAENEANEENDDQEDDKTRVKPSDELKNNQNCLVENQFRSKAKKMCKSEVKPVIVEKKDNFGNAISCGKTGYFYKVAYKVCVKKLTMKGAYAKLISSKVPSQENSSPAVHYPSTYQVCYDHLQNKVLFTEHRILSPYILRNLYLEDERALHEFPKKYSTETYGLENLKNLENIVKAYEQQQANFVDRQLLQMLVPTYDFALGNLIKTTFHIINCGLVHESKAIVWSTINLYVRDRLIQIFNKIGELKIFTGISGEQTVGESKEKLYLGNDQKSGITVPLFWWKVLYSAMSKKSVVIIMHNADVPKKICDEEKTACDVTKWKPYHLKKEDFEYVYCCSLSSASKSITMIQHLEIDLEHDVLKLD